LSTTQAGVMGHEVCFTFHYPSNTHSIKSSLQFSCNSVVINASVKLYSCIHFEYNYTHTVNLDFYKISSISLLRWDYIAFIFAFAWHGLYMRDGFLPQWILVYWTFIMCLDFLWNMYI
jgi:hypothetical protein